MLGYADIPEDIDTGKIHRDKGTEARQRALLDLEYQLRDIQLRVEQMRSAILNLINKDTNE